MASRSNTARRVAVGSLFVAALVVLAMPLAAGAADTPVNQELAQARSAIAPFHRTVAAANAGYSAFPEGVPLHECIADLQGHGAMGVHWANGSLVDTTLDPAHPEVLVYEPTANGRLALVAAEYFVFADAWAAEHGDIAPQMFGADMTYVPSPNRYEVPAFWQRHAWLFSHNPMGMFADHNPMVSCEHW